MTAVIETAADAAAGGPSRCGRSAAPRWCCAAS